MPTLDRLASEGLRYNNFHVTALCSPTRVALQTGRNHHTGNAGAVMDVSTAFPGNNGVRPNSVAPLAEMLRLNGFATGMFGKYHEAPPWEVSVSGPFDRWPTRSGFDKFYGFMGGETNQWAPPFMTGRPKSSYPPIPITTFTTDMTNQAIAWMKSQKSLSPDKPFFMYYAPGATHAPRHARKSGPTNTKASSTPAGISIARKRSPARCSRSALCRPAPSSRPSPRTSRIGDSLSADEKKLFARQMEVFARFAQHTDHEIGRLVDQVTRCAMGRPLYLYRR